MVAQVRNCWKHLIPELKDWMEFRNVLKSGGFKANSGFVLTAKGE